MEGTIREEWIKSLSLSGKNSGDSGDEISATLFKDVTEFKSILKVIEATTI